MRLPSGNALQRWLLPILALAAAAQIGALWYVNSKTASGTQHSLNAQQSEISRGGTTVQQTQAEINALLLDVRGLQVTINTLRGTDAAQDAENTSLQNQLAALEQAINQLEATTSGDGGQAAPSGTSTPAPAPCHKKHC